MEGMGWEGLLSEVYNKVGDRNAEIVWDIWGPEDFKQQFNNCLAMYNVPTTKVKDVPTEDTKKNYGQMLKSMIIEASM